MAKRSATTVINHDNWDDPYEPEIAGKFKPAGQEDLQKRVIKTAKRRITTQENSAPGENKNIFASFGGFKSAAPTSDSSKLFGFLGTNPSNKSKADQPNGDTHSQEITQSTSQHQYLSSLQQLNQSVSDWIKSHVDSNPFCILTPVFKDYEKHLKEIRKERDTSEKSTPISSAPVGVSFNFSTSSENKFPINVPTTPWDISKKTDSLTDNKVTNSFSNSDKQSLSVVGASDKTAKSPLLQGSDTSKPSLFSSFKSDSTSSSLFTKPDPASLMVNPFTSGLKKDDKPQEKPFSFSNGSTPTRVALGNAVKARRMYHEQFLERQLFTFVSMLLLPSGSSNSKIKTADE